MFNMNFEHVLIAYCVIGLDYYLLRKSSLADFLVEIDEVSPEHPFVGGSRGGVFFGYVVVIVE